MSDRKETPDLLGDILAVRQDDSDDRSDRSDNQRHDAATVHEASNRFGVSQRTIRTWAAEFAGHLSGGANPAKGEVRAFSYDDMTVLATIARLRTQDVSYKDIHTALKASPIVGKGEKADEPQPEVEGQPSGSSGERKGISQDLARQYKEQIEQLEGERDQLGEQVKALEGQVAEAQADRLEAEEPAVTAEDPETSQREGEEPPSAPEKVFTLEDQLRQLADRDRWWQLWKRK